MKKSHITAIATVIALALGVIIFLSTTNSYNSDFVYEPHNGLTYLGKEHFEKGEWYLISNEDVVTIILDRSDGAPTVASYSGFTRVCDEHGALVLNDHEWIPVYIPAIDGERIGLEPISFQH